MLDKNTRNHHKSASPDQHCHQRVGRSWIADYSSSDVRRGRLKIGCWCTEARTSDIHCHLHWCGLVWTPSKPSGFAKNSEDCPTRSGRWIGPYWLGGGGVQARDQKLPLYRCSLMFRSSTLMFKRWCLMFKRWRKKQEAILSSANHRPVTIGAHKQRSPP